MVRSLLTVLLLFSSLQPFLRQSNHSPEPSPAVFISLPEDVPSETVQIHYFMTGEFGGYGGNLETKPNQTEYKIDASVQGRAINSIKIIGYAPGCKFQAFEPDLMQSLSPRVRFDCEPLSKITIDGAIPSDLMGHENAELEIRYVAFWASRFFAVADGMVSEFQVATARPDLDGNFRVDIPDFSADETNSSHPGGANLRFMLRNSETLSPIAINLTPEQTEFQSETHQLRIRPSYPAGLKFIHSQELPESDGNQLRSTQYQPAEPERIPCTSPLTAPASQPSDSWACGALGRSPSQGRDAKPNFWRMRATRSEAFLRYSSGA